MSKKILIDATHPEETRVALVDGNDRLLDIDLASSTKQTLKSNIYLAKIIRVEPSLQAAFVDYGGNRHGFLAFNEIHPDYFRIPIADREALKAEMEKLAATLDEDQEQEEPASEGKGDDNTIAAEEASHPEEEASLQRKMALHHRYKIQEVIQRNQIILVQVVKEERGGKGAALTTYLSIAGRYSVLMPNSPRAGGISRKISNITDRKRLRKVLDGLSIPSGMGLIIRTAGKERTKIEIKKDADYLLRTWNEIRDTTLQSIAPSLIYAEDDIIKRSIRDLYDKDMDGIYIAGEEHHKTAKAFMKALMPTHAKHVHLYKDTLVSLFHAHRIEDQIDALHSPEVRLPSGGSIVIHPTEALVSIDINSGKATRERHIEDTALRTNLEAAEEIARQVRLRDLAGLIVIDFIDMEDNKHIAAVERKVRDAFREDRARIQIGRISMFGLLELSRQRLRPSLLETSARMCPHCEGTGHIRSVESLALQALRAVETEAAAHPTSHLLVTVPQEVAIFILNNKRSYLHEIEQRLKLQVIIATSTSLASQAHTLQRPRKDAAQLAPGETLEFGAPLAGQAAPKAPPAQKAPQGDHKDRSRNRSRPNHPQERAKPTSSVEVQSTEIEKKVIPLPSDEAATVIADELHTSQEKGGNARRNRNRRRSRGRNRNADKGPMNDAVGNQERPAAKGNVAEEPQDPSDAELQARVNFDEAPSSALTIPQVMPGEESKQQKGRKGRKSWWKKILD